METVLPKNVEQTPTLGVVESKDHLQKTYSVDFPMLPERKVCLARSTSVSSLVSSVSEDSIGSGYKLRDVLRVQIESRLSDRNKVKLNIAYDAVAYHYLDARPNNIEWDIPKGRRCTVDGVEKFEKEGETWYHVCYPVDGWVISEAFEVRAPSIPVSTVIPKPVARPVVRELSQERHEVIQEPQYAYGETVDCFVQKKWVRGTVLGTKNVITVRIGERTVELDHNQVQKTKTMSFTLLVTSDVRPTSDAVGFVCARLQKGTQVEVANVVGQYAQINAPAVGWFRCRTETEVFMVESNYVKPEEVRPTLKIFGPEAATQQEIVNCLSGGFTPEMRNAKVMAVVHQNQKKFVISFNKRWEAATVLRRAKSGEYKVRGQTLKMEWSLPYLKCYSFTKATKCRRC